MGVLDEAERFEPATPEDWSTWLAAHHADRSGVWLVTARKATGRQVLDYETAVCEALRFGWIDSVARPYDAERSMLWFARRRATSPWSRSNKQRIERLLLEDRLEAAGRAAVDVAKANGSWTVLDDAEDLVVPEDLAAAFAARPGAREHWDGFTPGARKVMLGWIAMARTAGTRARRVEETAVKAAQGLRAR